MPTVLSNASVFTNVHSTTTVSQSSFVTVIVVVTPLVVEGEFGKTVVLVPLMFTAALYPLKLVVDKPKTLTSKLLEPESNPLTGNVVHEALLVLTQEMEGPWPSQEQSSLNLVQLL